MTEAGTPPPTNLATAAVPVLVENLFRHAHGRLVSRLTRHMGPARLEDAADAVQHAMIQALRTWPFRGIPDAPEAWLYTTARNRVLDGLRREARLTRDHLEVLEPNLPRTPYLAGEVDDDMLRMIFVCCHPRLPEASRLALTLKTLCGLGASEIARVFLVAETTIAQRITRAKRLLKDPGIRFEIPEPDQLTRRLDSVARVLYLLFTEAHAASDGKTLIRVDLAAEALRLVDLVLGNPRTARPEIHALAALMHLQASRFPARLGADGLPVLLEAQDPSLWDQARIAIGLDHLRRAASGGVLSRYHCEAGIAAAHAQASGSAGPDWAYIVEMYEALEDLAPSPVITLNRAVAVARRNGAEAGLAIAATLTSDPAARPYRLLPAVLGALCLEAGRFTEAREHLGAALDFPMSPPERRLLEARLQRARAEAPREI